MWVMCNNSNTICERGKKEANLISIKQCFLYNQKKGLTLPGRRYRGPGNPLDNGPRTNE